MKDYDEECWITGDAPKAEFIGLVITTCKEKKYIKFEPKAGLKRMLSNQLKTDNGMTVAERHRADWHQRLDEIIDHHLNISQEK